MIPGLSLTKMLIGGAVVVGGGIGVMMLLSTKLPPATPLEELPDLVHDREGLAEAHVARSGLRHLQGREGLLQALAAQELRQPVGEGVRVLLDDGSGGVRTRTSHLAARRGAAGAARRGRRRADRQGVEWLIVRRRACRSTPAGPFSAAGSRPFGWSSSTIIGSSPRCSSTAW